jgi:diguanylate cyclase (GGDEF)-like protein/PAS domain S-box-containing protein
MNFDMISRLKNIRVNIVTKFVVLTSALIVLTSAIIVCFLIQVEKRNSYRDLVEKGRAYIHVLAEHQGNVINNENRAHLLRMMQGLQDENDIAYYSAYTADKEAVLRGKQIESVLIPDINTYKDEETGSYEDMAVHTTGEGYIDIIMPVYSDGEGSIAGYLQIGVSQAGIGNKIKEVVYPSILFIALLALIGIIITVVLAKRITTRINILNHATGNIANNILDEYVEIDTHDEFTDLALSFNNMLNNMQSYREQVEEHAFKLLEANERMKKEVEVRTRAEASLSRAQRRLKNLFLSTPIVIYSCKLSDLSFTFVSNNIVSLLGHESKDFLRDKRLWYELIHENDRSRAIHEICSVLDRGHISHEYRFLHKNGTYVWMFDEVRVIYDQEGNPQELIGYFTDITNRKRLEEKLVHDSLHDALTNLPNRALLLDRIEHYMNRARRYNINLFSVLFIDIDRFKYINDSLGHIAGDRLLTEVAERLKECIRPSDTIARLGGDEFGILLTDLKNIEEIETVSTRIQNRFAEPLIIEGHEFTASASIGIALNSDDYSKAEELLRDADLAMYRAKALGGARHIMFDKSMHTNVVTRLQMESDLRRAVNNNELCLYYQPILEAKTGKLSGFEALLRWIHPSRGFVPPAEFIPVAEDTGLIIEIGDWVLREACRQMSEWHERFPMECPPAISVNVSAKQFMPDMINKVKGVINETGLNGSYLKLEITESMIMQRAELISHLIFQLKEMDIRIQVDDFGTGYSSLSYLQRFPIDTLKIDRSFIGQISTEEESLEIVRAITSLAHILNMDVTAEGVETKEQHEIIRELDCEYVQGYLFYKPLPKEEVEQLFQQKFAAVKT